LWDDNEFSVFVFMIWTWTNVQITEGFTEMKKNKKQGQQNKAWMIDLWPFKSQLFLLLLQPSSPG